MSVAEELTMNGIINTYSLVQHKKPWMAEKSHPCEWYPQSWL
jgi:hypothetical protein